jgi:hypothetical protein
MLTQIKQPLFNNRSLVGHLDEMRMEGISCVPEFLHTNTTLCMLEELDSAQWHTASPEVGTHKIKQGYRYTGNFPESSIFTAVTHALQAQLNTACAAHRPDYLSVPLQFNDLLVHRYSTGDLGISPHRDGLRYLNVIAVFVVEGKGRFGRCDDREGTNSHGIRNEPGDLLLMRAPGFCGEDIQPFHFVDGIKSQRTSFALRHDRRRHHT